MRGRIYGILTWTAVAGFALSAAGQIAETRLNAASPANNRSAARLPYTAEFKVTHVQTLADGSTITRETSEVRARDSQGRTLIMSSTTPPGTTWWCIAASTSTILWLTRIPGGLFRGSGSRCQTWRSLAQCAPPAPEATWLRFRRQRSRRV